MKYDELARLCCSTGTGHGLDAKVGCNENGELVIIEYYLHGEIDVITHQHNGWVRVDAYYEDGTTETEYKR